MTVIFIPEVIMIMIVAVAMRIRIKIIYFFTLLNKNIDTGVSICPQKLVMLKTSQLLPSKTKTRLAQIIQQNSKKNNK
jgi:hypothetical protein